MVFLRFAISGLCGGSAGSQRMCVCVYVSGWVGVCACVSAGMLDCSLACMLAQWPQAAVVSKVINSAKPGTGQMGSAKEAVKQFSTRFRTIWLRSGQSPLDIRLKIRLNPLKTSVFRGTRHTPTGPIRLKSG